MILAFKGASVLMKQFSQVNYGVYINYRSSLPVWVKVKRS
jgi:hypothetical protein